MVAKGVNTSIVAHSKGEELVVITVGVRDDAKIDDQSVAGQRR